MLMLFLIKTRIYGNIHIKFSCSLVRTNLKGFLESGEGIGPGVHCHSSMKTILNFKMGIAY